MTYKHTVCPVCKVRVVQNPAHAASFQHQHAADLRTLLADPLTNVSAIARKFGVSRQLVHVAIENMGIKRIDTMSRWAIRAAREVQEIVRLKPILSLAGPGFHVAPVVVKSGENYRTSPCLLVINGRRCLIRHTRPSSPSLLKKFGKGYVQLSGLRVDSHLNKGVRYVIYILDPSAPVEGCLVVPIARVKPGGIIIKLGAYKPGFPRSNPAEWRGYLNNWTAFMQRGSAPLGTPGRHQPPRKQQAA